MKSLIKKSQLCVYLCPAKIMQVVDEEQVRAFVKTGSTHNSTMANHLEGIEPWRAKKLALANLC